MKRTVRVPHEHVFHSIETAPVVVLSDGAGASSFPRRIRSRSRRHLLLYLRHSLASFLYQCAFPFQFGFNFFHWPVSRYPSSAIRYQDRIPVLSRVAPPSLLDRHDIKRENQASPHVSHINTSHRSPFLCQVRIPRSPRKPSGNETDGPAGDRSNRNPDFAHCYTSPFLYNQFLRRSSHQSSAHPCQ